MCNVCNKVIKYKGTFNRHVQSHQKSFKCFLCDLKFNREDKLKKHERGHLSGYKKPENQYNCQHCREAFNNYINLFDHVKIKHPRATQYGSGQHQTSTDNALEDSVHVLKIYPVENDRYDLLTFDANIRDTILYHLKQRCEKVNQIKWYLSIQVEFMRETHDGQPYLTTKYNEHYCYIKNLNKLLSRTKTNGHQHRFCRNCFQGFTSQTVLDKHSIYCSKYDAQHLKFPTEGDEDIVEFGDFSKQMRVPFVIYCDFEALIIMQSGHLFAKSSKI